MSSDGDLHSTITDIVTINSFLNDFWGDGAWAPPKASELLSDARLDRQVHLSHTLRVWIDGASHDDSEGRLILAWANLGALLEATMTWFLCVHEDSYAQCPNLRPDGPRFEPDDIQFKALCDYFEKHIWSTPPDAEYVTFVDSVRRYRNAIHLLRDYEVSSWNTWKQSVVQYLKLLADHASRVEYPTDEFDIPDPVSDALKRIHTST